MKRHNSKSCAKTLAIYFILLGPLFLANDVCRKLCNKNAHALNICEEIGVYGHQPSCQCLMSTTITCTTNRVIVMKVIFMRFIIKCPSQWKQHGSTASHYFSLHCIMTLWLQVGGDLVLSMQHDILTFVQWGENLVKIWARLCRYYSLSFMENNCTQSGDGNKIPMKLWPRQRQFISVIIINASDNISCQTF